MKPSRTSTTRGRGLSALGLGLGFALAAASCVSANDRPVSRPDDDDDAGLPGVSLDGGGGTTMTTPPDAEPHSVLGIEPPHGPFSGGTLALMRGNGFASNARVWIGGAELAPEAVVAIDAQRLQVVVPPGMAGPADVVVQNGDDESTRSTLNGGYFFDAFYATPPDGPTAGGTLIRLLGKNTGWNEETSIEIDQEPCAIEEVVSAEELRCRTPAGTPGAKLVRSSTEGELIDVLDAFTYVNSDNGFRGGLSGDPLVSELTVLVFDDITGEAVKDAHVIVGTQAESAVRGLTDSNGVALIADDTLAGSATVTVARHCFQPITFVDVPSSRLTVYLEPVLSPACGAGGQLPGGGGGTPGRGSTITGELVWEATGEFRRSGWTNVPPLVSEDEQYVAYVFRLSSDPSDDFSLPSAVNAITPSAEGTAGYDFYMSTVPGNHTLYALAGIETRSGTTASFTAYAMGLVRGVAVAPSDTRENIYINIDVPLDHALTLDIGGPKPTSRGPDRLRATTAIGVGSQGYVLLPNGQQTRLLPLSGSLDFVGVPPLIGSLTGTEYVVTARAVTGEAGTTPLSAIGMLSSTVTSEPIGADAFVEIPKLVTPELNSAWNGTDLELDFTAGGAPVDLTIVDLASGGGLITWRIVAPGARKTLKVPDLRAFGDMALSPGALGILVTSARIDDFSYGSLLYRDLGPRGWRAHASDLYYASF